MDHGGEDQALYAYSQADADYWAAELGRDIPPGYFGENLRVAGLDATNAVIGERWKIGLDVEVEVTSPRRPCSTFQRRVGEPHWVKRFTEAGRVGAYLRVVRPGTIQAGDHIHRLYVPAHGVTVGKWFADPTSRTWMPCATPKRTARSGYSPSTTGVREAAGRPHGEAGRTPAPCLNMPGPHCAAGVRKLTAAVGLSVSACAARMPYT